MGKTQRMARSKAEHRARMPESTAKIVDRRSLRTDHRRLAEVLRPGMSVLDAGCGTGAITRGVAEAVGSTGFVVGLDSNSSFLSKARSTSSTFRQLSFVAGDVCQLPFRAAFDLVTASRVLQWLDHPAEAVQSMARVTKLRGRLLILDYNHEKIFWEPAPPASMQVFYRAFLKWREDAGMDNAIADHLEDLFWRLGLRDVRVSPQHELARRGDVDFETRCGIWAEVAASRGHQMVADRVVTESLRAKAEIEYREWMRTVGRVQRLYLLAAEGVRS